MKNIKEATKQFLELKQKTCNESGRESSEVIVIGASKTQSIQSIRQAYEGGITNFGENYLQEAEEKISQLPSDITWHFIGAIQSKKSKKIARMFDWVHTIDRVEIAQLLNSARPKELEQLNVCVQVNLDREESKSGINLEEVDNFLLEIESLDNLNVRGLMVIPKPKDNERQRLSFKKLKNKWSPYNSVATWYLWRSIDPIPVSY